MRANIEKIIPCVFSYWTLMNATELFTSLTESSQDSSSFLMKPHIGQVLAVMRAFSIENKNNAIQNHAL